MAENGYLQVPPEAEDTGGRFDRFVQIIAALRGEGGCPWDREQTHQSIARNIIEEAYEAEDAIMRGDVDDMVEELGDVLLEVVLQAQIGADGDEFTVDDVVDGISDKIVRRHPHVFGEEAAFGAAGLTDEEQAQVEAIRTPGDVGYLWDYIKVREKRLKAEARERRAEEAGVELPRRSVLDDVPRSEPALMQASDISRKAVARGFEWDTRDDIWGQVREEVGEYEEAHADPDASQEDREMEFGDILFALVNVARRDGIDPETALRKSCGKFRSRWSMMEKYAEEEGRALESHTTAELDDFWNRAKQALSD